MSEDLFQDAKDKVKAKIAAAKKSTGTDEIVCIVDRSGSMSSIKEDASGGLNEFIKEQVDLGNANLTIVEFDNTVETVCDRINITEAEEYVLHPRGGTALLDAIGAVVGNDLKYNAPDGKTIVVIVTDGGENASREWNRDQIFKLIAERKDAGWEFLFLASNQDAISTGASYGFAAEDSLSFGKGASGIQAGTQAASGYVGSLRTMSKGDALNMKAMYAATSADLSDTGAVDAEDILGKNVPDDILKDIT